jgi:hypothetical protein
MTKYYARILDAENGNEAGYEFDGPPDLMGQAADDVIGTFFDQVDKLILEDHVDWELNGALNNRQRRVVTAIGSLIPKAGTPPIPFLLMISDHDGEKGTT